MSPTKWTQKDSPFRYLYMITKQFKLTLLPVIATAGMIGLWYFVFWRHQIMIARGDSEHLLLFSAVALMLAIFFLGGFLYTKIDDRRDQVVKAVLGKDKVRFLMLRDERTPNFSLVFLGTLSILLTMHSVLLSWETVWGGLSAVGTVTFICSKLWILITYLDDPIDSSKWIKERVPKGWLDINIDEFFKCDGTEEPCELVQLAPPGEE
jgi:hypothetical protein